MAILKSLARPKNKLQMAHELQIDWKAVDSHVKRLLAFGLVLEWALAGTCRLYVISEKGKHALELLEQPEYSPQSI
jgi:predicted transcriptional regulator